MGIALIIPCGNPLTDCFVLPLLPYQLGEIYQLNPMFLCCFLTNQIYTWDSFHEFNLYPCIKKSIWKCSSSMLLDYFILTFMCSYQIVFFNQVLVSNIMTSVRFVWNLQTSRITWIKLNVFICGICVVSNTHTKVQVHNISSRLEW